MEDTLYRLIVKTYLDTESVKETADILGTSVVKVRKVLLTEGLWSSRTSLEIRHYLNLGKTTAEIACILCTTEKAVQQYLPYTRGFYNSENLSSAAVNCSNYRERIRIAQEKTLRKNNDIAKKNKWDELYIKEPEIKKEYIRLHLELVHDDKKEYSKILRKYGNVSYGKAITRDIIVPLDIPLWALNYVIQKCFGWQNSHLHYFRLSNDQFKKLINNSFSNFCTLVGVVFRAPWIDENAKFWQDDYESGSFKTWLRSKYKGPYINKCYEEGIGCSKYDLNMMEEAYHYVEVEHYFGENGREHYDHLKPIEKGEYYKRKAQGPVEGFKDRYGIKESVIEEVYEFIDIPMDGATWMSMNDFNQLLERLSISEVLLVHDKDINGKILNPAPECFESFMSETLSDEIKLCEEVDRPDMQPHITPVCDSLYYNYDFGDNWLVKITASNGADDLLESGRLTREEFDEAIKTLRDKYTPVCIGQDGYPVLDDVGGMYGYIEFLKGINGEGEYDSIYEDAKESLEWAKSLGWSKRKTGNKNLL